MKAVLTTLFHAPSSSEPPDPPASSPSNSPPSPQFGQHHNAGSHLGLEIPSPQFGQHPGYVIQSQQQFRPNLSYQVNASQNSASQNSASQNSASATPSNSARTSPTITPLTPSTHQYLQSSLHDYLTSPPGTPHTTPRGSLESAGSLDYNDTSDDCDYYGIFLPTLSLASTVVTPILFLLPHLDAPLSIVITMISLHLAAASYSATLIAPVPPQYVNVWTFFEYIKSFASVSFALVFASITLRPLLPCNLGCHSAYSPAATLAVFLPLSATLSPSASFVLHTATATSIATLLLAVMFRGNDDIPTVVPPLLAVVGGLTPATTAWVAVEACPPAVKTPAIYSAHALIGGAVMLLLLLLAGAGTGEGGEEWMRGLVAVVAMLSAVRPMHVLATLSDTLPIPPLVCTVVLPAIAILPVWSEEPLVIILNGIVVGVWGTTVVGMMGRKDRWGVSLCAYFTVVALGAIGGWVII